MDLLLVIVPVLAIGAIVLVLVVARNNRYRRPLPDAPLDEPEWPPAHPEPPEPPHEVEVEEPEPEPPIVLPPEPEPERPQHEREGDVQEGTLSWPLVRDINCSVLQPDFTVLWNTQGLVSIRRDDSAPHSPPGVVQFRFPKGTTDGEYKGCLVIPFQRRLRQLYTKLWFKYSANWQGQRGGSNKLIYLTGAGGSMPWVVFGEGGKPPFYIRAYPQFGDLSANRSQVRGASNIYIDTYRANGWLLPNENPLPVPPGRWFTLEVLVDTLAAETVTEWWLDGVLQGRYYGVAYPSGGILEEKIHPVWGGQDSDVKRQDDELLLDHVIVRGQ